MMDTPPQGCHPSSIEHGATLFKVRASPIASRSLEHRVEACRLGVWVSRPLCHRAMGAGAAALRWCGEEWEEGSMGVRCETNGWD
jgi:hypothetical protein